MRKALYQTFLDERRYLKNCSSKTLRSYTQAWNAFEPFLARVKTADEIRAAIKAGRVLRRSPTFSPEGEISRKDLPRRNLKRYFRPGIRFETPGRKTITKSARS